MFTKGDLIIRTDLGNRLTTPAEPPPIAFELRYTGTTLKGYLAGELHRSVHQFLRKEKLYGDVMLRSSDKSAGSLHSDMLAMRILVEMSLRNKDGGVVVQDELLTR